MLEHACRTGVYFVNLKVSLSGGDSEVHRATAKCFVILSKRSIAFKAAGSERVLSTMTEVRNETLEGGVKKDFKIGSGASNAGGCSSWFA